MTQTAFYTAPVRTLAQIAATPFVALWNGMVALAEAGPRMKQIERLNATTDDQLSAMGKTRESEVRRIFGASFYI